MFLTAIPCHMYILPFYTIALTSEILWKIFVNVLYICNENVLQLLLTFWSLIYHIYVYDHKKVLLYLCWESFLGTSE